MSSSAAEIIVIHDTDSESEGEDLTLDSDSSMDDDDDDDSDTEEERVHRSISRPGRCLTTAQRNSMQQLWNVAVQEAEELDVNNDDSDDDGNITDFDSEDDAGECQCFMAPLEGTVVAPDDIPRFDPGMSCSDVLDALIGDDMYLCRRWTDGRTYSAVLMSSALEARKEVLKLFNKSRDDSDNDDSDAESEIDSDAEDDLREAKDLIRVLRIHGTSEGRKQCGFCVANDTERFHGHRSIHGVINNPPPLRRVFHS